MLKKKQETTEEKLMYREPMTVTEILVYKNINAYPVCPRCKISFETEYQSFCDRCGQMLSWKGFSKAKIVTRIPP